MVQPLSADAERLAEVTRESRGRLLALLAAAGRDIVAAEDALADATERALRRWPTDGVPANPEAWLLVVARNRLRDSWKSAAHRSSVALDEIDCETVESNESTDLPDRRLALMMVCAHPAIAESVRTPLMLQVVLGVEAAAIAAAFAVEPAAMAQRLVRAKKRIRDAGIPFVVPERDRLAERLPALLEAVYGAYAIDWQLGERRPIESLSAEALHLALLLAELLPDEPEVLGLAALMCLSEARRPARAGADGSFVPLDEQDVERWDRALIARGERLLTRAHGHRRPGRFQYEAAIQSVHASRPVSGPLDADALRTLRTLHRALVRVSPSLGAGVALAALDGELDGPEVGLRALDALGPGVEHFQPALVVRAHLLDVAGRSDAAGDCYRRAIALTSAPAVAKYLSERLRAAIS
jgi:RNA polymerase sigma-70 factor (ECF subfamily)